VCTQKAWHYIKGENAIVLVSAQFECACVYAKGPAVHQGRERDCAGERSICVCVLVSVCVSRACIGSALFLLCSCDASYCEFKRLLQYRMSVGKCVVTEETIL